GGHRWDVWRAVLIAAALITTATHVPITEDHFEEAPYIGVLFVLLEIAGVALAVLLARRGDRRRYLAAAAVGGLAILAYVLSRSMGLPEIGDDVGNWVEPLGIVALTAEATLLVGGLAAAAGHGGFRVARRAAVVVTAVLVCAGVGATVAANAAQPAMAPAK